MLCAQLQQCMLGSRELRPQRREIGGGGACPTRSSSGAVLSVVRYQLTG
jgi:hypothetical protein